MALRSYTEHLNAPTLGVPFSRPGTIEGRAGGSCGVICTFMLDIDDAGRIRDAAVRVRGRAAAFALASALVEAGLGRTVLEAARLGIHSVHPDFRSLSMEDRERALVVEDAFHHALGAWCVRQARSVRLGEAKAPQRQVGSAMVAMSGGVDSAVALHSAAESLGKDTVGTTLRLWIDPAAPDPDAACCAPSSVRRARSTCHEAGLGHISVDLRTAFTKAVVEPFVAAYVGGETPNPCVGCNGHFRLDELVHIADALGLDQVVTGHYARRVERDGDILLRRAVDLGKDQSYMLARVHPRVLRRLRFPLGEQLKTQTRSQASAIGLPQATIADSQEICFLGGADYRTFLARNASLGPSGAVVHVDGRVLGKHDGIARFTPGQRRGLGGIQDGDRPLYVVRTDRASGAVVVGPRESLATDEVPLRSARLHPSAQGRPLVARLRYRAGPGGTPVTMIGPDAGGRAQLRLHEPAQAPAPGQLACIFDDEDVVVGTGFIGPVG